MSLSGRVTVIITHQGGALEAVAVRVLPCRQTHRRRTGGWRVLAWMRPTTTRTVRLQLVVDAAHVGLGGDVLVRKGSSPGTILSSRKRRPLAMGEKTWRLISD